MEGGIKDLYNWYWAYRSESIWKRAAGVYVRILSKPQLFIEGNNRTGSLLVSYLLMRAGLPPFVLTLDNAEGYFNPSSVIRNSAKHGVKALYELPKIKKSTPPSSKRRRLNPNSSSCPAPVCRPARGADDGKVFDAGARQGRWPTRVASHRAHIQAPADAYFLRYR